MKYKIIPRQASILIFGDHATNYVASTQVFIYGDRGFMYNTHGKQFYEGMIEHGRKIMHEMGVISLEGYQIPSHARLMRSVLRKSDVSIEITGKGHIAGHEMLWVVMTPKGR